MHPGAAHFDRLGVEIHHQFAGLNDRLGVALGATDDGVDARDKLVLVKGLGKVVVSADPEALDLVFGAGEV